jgi:hypothetical protein
MNQINYMEATEGGLMGAEDDSTPGLPHCLLLYSPLAPKTYGNKIKCLSLIKSMTI